MEMVEEEVEAGRMEGAELFFLTNNAMAEDVYYRGKSSDKDIFDLMLLLVYLELRGCFRLHIIWVAGKKQTSTGIYGFTRGCLTYRIALSGSILDFVLLNETDFERYVSLLTWVWTWIGANNIEPLTPEVWFEEGRGSKGVKNNYYGIWMPYHYNGMFDERLPLQWHTWC